MANVSRRQSLLFYRGYLGDGEPVHLLGAAAGPDLSWLAGGPPGGVKGALGDDPDRHPVQEGFYVWEGDVTWRANGDPEAGEAGGLDFVFEGGWRAAVPGDLPRHGIPAVAGRGRPAHPPRGEGGGVVTAGQDVRDLINLARLMRGLQRRWFGGERTHELLLEARDAERRFDRALDALEAGVGGDQRLLF
jgi:hypothetical protein